MDIIREVKAKTVEAVRTEALCGVLETILENDNSHLGLQRGTIPVHFGK